MGEGGRWEGKVGVRERGGREGEEEREEGREEGREGEGREGGGREGEREGRGGETFTKPHHETIPTLIEQVTS